MEKPKIVAFLGTGLMGFPMAKNILQQGHTVKAWNRSAGKAEPLAQFGGKVTASVQEACAGADFVISMLTDGNAVQKILEADKLLACLQPDCIWIDMSSTKPSEARAQAARLEPFDIHHLDAPVSGGTKGAETAELAIMVGGEKSIFEQTKPLLSALGRPVLVGPSGSGQLAKLANQAIVGVTIGAVAEAMLLLEAGGADPAAVRYALRGGFADCTILQQHGARMTERDFTPGGPAKIQLKDLNNVLVEANDLGLTLPVTKHIRDRFHNYVDHMNGADMDHSGLYLELRSQNGLKKEP